jgi:Domain of unknown function (DUF4258)
MTSQQDRRYRVSSHARFEMQRRAIDEETVKQVLSQPEQERAVRPGRVLRQSRITIGGGGRRYLVRLIVDVDRDVPEIVTVYRTSKIEKYWRAAR